MKPSEVILRTRKILPANFFTSQKYNASLEIFLYAEVLANTYHRYYLDNSLFEKAFAYMFLSYLLSFIGKKQLEESIVTQLASLGIEILGNIETKRKKENTQPATPSCKPWLEVLKERLQECKVVIFPERVTSEIPKSRNPNRIYLNLQPADLKALPAPTNAQEFQDYVSRIMKFHRNSSFLSILDHVLDFSLTIAKVFNRAIKWLFGFTLIELVKPADAIFKDLRGYVPIPPKKFLPETTADELSQNNQSKINHTENRVYDFKEEVEIAVGNSSWLPYFKIKLG